MKQFIFLLLVIGIAIPAFSQLDLNKKTTPVEKLFVKHVDLVTKKTETWEINTDNPVLISSDFIAGTKGETPISFIDEKGLKSLDLIQRIDKNPDYPENTILLCDNKIDKLIYSGVLVRSRHLLASGKVYYSAAQSPEKIFVTSLDYAKKLNGYEFAYATDIYFFSTNPNDFQNDIAVITLDRPLGAVLGWMGYGYNTDDNYYKQNIFNITKLDYFTQNTLELRKYSASADMVQENGLYYQPFENFIPGAPVYNQDESVQGIISHWARTYPNGDTTYYVGASRITKVKFNTICSIIDAATPTKPDLIPLQIKVIPNKIDVLDQLEEINYRLFNGSSASFTGNVKLDIYLSTDNLIDTNDVKITSLVGNISMASNYFFTSGTTKDLYLPLSLKPGKYYVGTILTADELNLENNVTKGVDCDTLWVKNGLANNYISGKIITSGASSGLGFCLLFEHSEKGLGKLYDISEVDESLNYEFENIFLGRYIIVYVPLYSNNLLNAVTYYNQTPYWQNASVIEMGLKDTIRNADIQRIELTPLTGNKTISGNLSLVETKSAKSTDAAFFKNISIIVENQSNPTIIGFCNPDSTGFYQLKNLSVGDYSISIDKPGFTLTKKHPISIFNELTEIQDLNFIFYPDSTIEAKLGTVAHDIRFKKDFEIFPNPANDYIKISSNYTNMNPITIDIINILGEKVSSYRLVSGNTAIVNIKELPQGNYVVRLMFSDVICTKKMIKN